MSELTAVAEQGCKVVASKLEGGFCLILSPLDAALRPETIFWVIMDVASHVVPRSHSSCRHRPTSRCRSACRSCWFTISRRSAFPRQWPLVAWCVFNLLGYRSSSS